MVQQWHSQLQCGNIVYLKLQSILVPALRYGGQLWGMHTPTGEGKAAQADLQSIHDTFLNAFVGSSMPLGLYCHCSAGRTGYVTSASLLEAADFRVHNTIAATVVLSILLFIPFLCLTLFVMPLMWGVVLRTFLSPLPLACSLLGVPCHVIAVLCLFWRLAPLLRLCTNNYRVLTVMPLCESLGSPICCGCQRHLPPVV